MTSLVAQTVKNPSAMWETWVQFLGLEGPPEGMASRSTILVWRICMDREKPGRLQSMGLQKVGHDWTTKHSMPWLDFPGGTLIKNLPASAGHAKGAGLFPVLGRYLGGGNGHPPQYSCLENSMGRGDWRATVHGVAESDMTEGLTTHTWMSCLQSGHHAVYFFHLVGISVSIRQLTEYVSECYI